MVGELKAGLYDRATDKERVLHTVAPHVDVPAVPAREKAAAHYTLVMLDNTKSVLDMTGYVPQEVILDTVDGMENLEEAAEEDIDPNMPDMLEWNEEIGAHGYPDNDDGEDEEEEGGQGGEEPPAVRSNTRGNGGVPPIRYDDVFELVADIISPPTVAMALDGKEGAEWAAAMEAELDSLWKNEIYEEVPRPSGKVIGTKWVLRVKIDAPGNLDKFKGKVVAKGFRQV